MLNKTVFKHLYRIAGEIDQKHMDMTHFFDHFGDHPAHRKRNGKLDPHGCGTTACFFGHAASDTKFCKAVGHNLHIGRGKGGEYIPMASGSVGRAMRYDVFQGIARLLNISYDAATYLFGAGQDGRTAELRKRLKVVMKDKDTGNSNYYL